MPNLKDLTGQKFGKLTAIEAIRDKNGRIKWKCKCDCGNEVLVFSSNLIRFHSTSCGCSHIHEDLIGRDFGELTVISFDNNRSTNKKLYWICKCSCGNEISVNGAELRGGVKKSCNEFAHNNIIGKRFGRLVGTNQWKHIGNRYHYKCLCDCGNITYVQPTNLLNGNTKSCGCLQKQRREEQVKRNTKHGMSKSRIHNIWSKMKARCLNESCKEYKYYGERGITICDDWLSFEMFYQWAFETGYTDELTIERIDVNGNYCPDNCKWISKKEQNNNKTNTVFVEYNGECKTLAQWANEYNIPYSLLHARYTYYKWPFELCLTAPKFYRYKKDVSK